MPNKRAIIVGIDVYPNPINNLNSCVNDSLAFRSMLINTYGFASSDITLIQNQDATYAHVTAAMDAAFAGAHPGDELVYFESSHGYRYAKNNVMTEVLCLYDKFLEDQDFVQHTQGLPSGVLTVVLDACHSGGMEKSFFVNGQTMVARAKVFTPPESERLLMAGLLQQVTDYKFFGRSATANANAIANSLHPPDVVKSFVNIPAQKDLGDAQLELDGVLFAACTSAQTALAGSPATNNLSAFTYGLTTQLDTTVSLRDLCSMVGTRLAEMNMQQTPVFWAPLAEQGLADKTFITGQPATGGPVQKEFDVGGRLPIEVNRVIAELQKVPVH